MKKKRQGEKGKKSEDSRQAPTRKTKDAVDRRQNNKILKGPERQFLFAKER